MVPQIAVRWIPPTASRTGIRRPAHDDLIDADPSREKTRGGNQLGAGAVREREVAELSVPVIAPTVDRVGCRQAAAGAAIRCCGSTDAFERQATRNGNWRAAARCVAGAQLTTAIVAPTVS